METEISFNYETDFELTDESKLSDWLVLCAKSKGFHVGELSYIFCDDDYLLDLNQRYLNHNTLTDIITFDYTEGTVLSGDVFVSIDRVRENAKFFEVKFETELLRVMSHGVLHLMGYKDKADSDKKTMRSKEDELIQLFHVEQ